MMVNQSQGVNSVHTNGGGNGIGDINNNSNSRPNSSNNGNSGNLKNTINNNDITKNRPDNLHIQYIEKFLSHYVWQAIDFDMLDSAEFTMEKLLAINPENPSSKHLMGIIFYRQGKYKAAANITNCSTTHLGCIYIYAKSCLKLKMYSKGIEALERTKHEWWTLTSEHHSSFNERWIIPDQPILSALLGKLYHLQGDKVNAVKSYTTSVRFNPFLWDPIEAMCKLGIKVRSMNIFRMEYLNEFGVESENSNTNIGTSVNDPFTTPNSTVPVVPSGIPTNVANTNSTNGPSNNPFFTFKSSLQFLKNTNGITKPANGISSTLPSATTTTSTSISAPTSLVSDSSNKTPSNVSNDSFNTPSESRSSRQNQGLPLAPQKRSSRNVAASSIPSTVEPKPPLPFPRRSARIAQTTTSTITGAGQKRNLITPSSRTTSTVSQAPPPHQPFKAASNVSSTSTIPTNPITTTNLTSPLTSTATTSAALKRSRFKADRDSLARKDAQLYIINIYRQITSAFVHFSRYECKQAISIFNQLPDQQKNTPWVLSKLGRCYFEMVEYKESDKIFKKLRQLDRCRTKDMEYYSTLLWHLRKDVELSFLAHELMDIDRNSPQAWCALGNSFSLRRDTNQALKCFKRAINIDGDSPYPYTLLAHEQVTTEAYESAQDSFRLAIKADNRHYNAWYGLGMVFMRLDNFEYAALHFSRATLINPSNVILICCIGMVLEKKGLFNEALEQYKKACEIQPNSALARYKKARALIQLKLYNAALVEFDHLQTLAPDEASVHFLLAQLYKLLSNRSLAIKHFTIALNLDPKGSALIKDAIEGLNVLNSTTS